MTGEEIFLISITKTAQDLNYTQLSEFYFGGCPTRFIFSHAWFLRYANGRYQHALNIEGLSRYVHLFPSFAKAIARKMNRQTFKVDPLTGQRIPVLSIVFDENRFNIFGFIDGSVWETCTPGSGPDGDYIGAMRHPWSILMQMSAYSGYKKNSWGVNTINNASKWAQFYLWPLFCKEK